MKTLLVAILTVLSFVRATPAISQASPGNVPEVSWKRLVPNVLEDQRRIWSFPVRLVKGKDLVPFAAVLGTTASLLALDPIEAHYFRRTAAFQRFNQVFSGNATAVGTVVAPVSLYLAGLIRGDSRMQGTALLAGEAVADAEILTTTMKDVDRRARPSDIALNGNYWDSWLDSPGNALSNHGSFPSGHSIAAFSVATVIARRYGNSRRWVPYAAYGMAAMVGFSRLSLSAHFTSDVFMGGALGYSIGRMTAFRQ